jgi:PucR family transcriptional regulator, purine catabolism regulatory protein
MTASPPTPVTIESFLALPVVQHGDPEVLAGAGHLDREIRWVHAGEVPHIASLLKGRELLLTTGMGIGRGQPEQRRFVAELAGLGVTALVIELGTTLERVPAALVDAAERHELCLIAFHREVRFVEITEAVHREIVDQRGELLRRGEALHQRFTGLLLSGAKVPDVLSELAEFVANPVVLERAGRGIAYHVTNEADDATVLSAWTSFDQGRPNAPEAIARRVPMGGEESWGRLIVMAVDSPLGEQDRVAVERAVGLIALALMRSREEEGLASRARGDFLGSLPTTQASENELRERAGSLGFGEADVGLLPIATMRAPDAPRSAGIEDAGWDLIQRDVQHGLEQRRIPFLAGGRGHGEQMLLVLGLANRGDRRRIADLVASMIHSASARHLQDPDAAVVSVSSLCETWTEAGRGLSAASDALPAAAHGRRRPWHDASAADTDRLLWSLRDRPELHRYAELQLRPLLERDRHSQPKLVPTLVEFCKHSGRKAETARALQIERQSLYHRLARIEEVLGVDLSDGDTILGLFLALRASRYFELDELRVAQ